MKHYPGCTPCIPSQAELDRRYLCHEELVKALKLCERALECRDTEAEEHAAKEARRVLRLAEGGKP